MIGSGLKLTVSEVICRVLVCADRGFLKLFGQKQQALARLCILSIFRSLLLGNKKIEGNVGIVMSNCGLVSSALLVISVAREQIPVLSPGARAHRAADAVAGFQSKGRIALLQCSSLECPRGLLFLSPTCRSNERSHSSWWLFVGTHSQGGVFPKLRPYRRHGFAMR